MKYIAFYSLENVIYKYKMTHLINIVIFHVWNTLKYHSCFTCYNVAYSHFTYGA